MIDNETLLAFARVKAELAEMTAPMRRASDELAAMRRIAFPEISKTYDAIASIGKDLYQWR